VFLGSFPEVGKTNENKAFPVIKTSLFFPKRGACFFLKINRIAHNSKIKSQKSKKRPVFDF